MDQDGCSLEWESRNLEKTWKNSDAGLSGLVHKVWKRLGRTVMVSMDWYARFFFFIPSSKSVGLTNCDLIQSYSR
jgi:hypothetical protein